MAVELCRECYGLGPWASLSIWSMGRPEASSLGIAFYV